MENKKLSLDDFGSNELSRNQKKKILGKGDLTLMLNVSVGGGVLTSATTVISTATESNVPGPGDGSTKGNGDGRGV